MSYIANIISCSLSIPEYGALYIIHLLVKAMLGRQLMTLRIRRISKLRRTLDILTYIKRTVAGIFVPPLDEGLVICRLVTNLPIDLRRTVINEAIVNPEENICIEIIVVLKTESLRSNRRVFPVAIDTERRNAELHPRLDTMDGFTQLLDEPAHIISSPIADITESARIGCIHLLIRNLLASYRIRIEVIVDMKPIDIITVHNISSHLTSIICSLLKCRIEKHEIIIVETEVRLLLHHALG